MPAKQVHVTVLCPLCCVHAALYNTAVLDDLFSSAGGAGLKGGARGSTGSSNSGGPPRSKL